MSILRATDRVPAWAEWAYAVGKNLVKSAGTPEVAYNLVGVLHLTQTGYLCLSVPNAMALGVFKAMEEPGLELPPGPNGGQFNAHVTVMTKEEVEKVGGPEQINERGKQFHYSLGRLMSVEPDGWPEMSKVWMVKIFSPELQFLRRSYGLSSLPGDGERDFHISVGVVRRGVLARNAKGKGSA